MARAITQRTLERETEVFRGSGGVSQENTGYGFRPAFLDTRTRTIHLSRYGDGRPAPMHLIQGLPDDLVLDRDLLGRALMVRACVVSGFVRDGHFYTRDEAARLTHTPR